MQIVPAIVGSGALARRADLELQRRSPFGRHVARHMTPTRHAMRRAGNAVMTFGAWYRRPSVLILGLIMVLVGWGRSKLGLEVAN